MGLTYLAKCRDCGKHVSHSEACAAGLFAKSCDGSIICYDCCAKCDQQQMRETGRAVLYLVKHPCGGYTVNNWPGTLSIKVGRHAHGRHNIAGERIDVWFLGPDGCNWWGVTYGKQTQLCHCRRVKS